MENYLVAYDVIQPKRANKIRKFVYGYAFGGQKSALECLMEPSDISILITLLKIHMDASDTIHIIQYYGKPKLFGKAKSISLEEGAIIL